MATLAKLRQALAAQKGGANERVDPVTAMREYERNVVAAYRGREALDPSKKDTASKAVFDFSQKEKTGWSNDNGPWVHQVLQRRLAVLKADNLSELSNLGVTEADLVEGKLPHSMWGKCINNSFDCQSALSALKYYLDNGDAPIGALNLSASDEIKYFNALDRLNTLIKKDNINFKENAPTWATSYGPINEDSVGIFELIAAFGAPERTDSSFTVDTLGPDTIGFDAHGRHTMAARNGYVPVDYTRPEFPYIKTDFPETIQPTVYDDIGVSTNDFKDPNDLIKAAPYVAQPVSVDPSMTYGSDATTNFNDTGRTDMTDMTAPYDLDKTLSIGNSTSMTAPSDLGASQTIGASTAMTAPSGLDLSQTIGASTAFGDTLEEGDGDNAGRFAKKVIDYMKLKMDESPSTESIQGTGFPGIPGIPVRRLKDIFDSGTLAEYAEFAMQVPAERERFKAVFDMIARSKDAVVASGEPNMLNPLTQKVPASAMLKDHAFNYGDTAEFGTGLTNVAAATGSSIDSDDSGFATYRPNTVYRTARDTAGSDAIGFQTATSYDSDSDSDLSDYSLRASDFDDDDKAAFERSMEALRKSQGPKLPGI